MYSVSQIKSSKIFKSTRRVKIHLNYYSLKFGNRGRIFFNNSSSKLQLVGVKVLRLGVCPYPRL